MIRDSIGSDITMFIHYSTLNIDGKDVLKIDVEEGDDKPYFLKAKGLGSDGVFIRMGTSSAPASFDKIKHMIQKTSKYVFEKDVSSDQNLHFERTKNEFKKKNLPFGKAQNEEFGSIKR